jgi:hypothetical protein
LPVGQGEDIGSKWREDAVLEESEWLILKPAPPRSLLARLAALRPLDEEFSPVDKLPTND